MTIPIIADPILSTPISDDAICIVSSALSQDKGKDKDLSAKSIFDMDPTLMGGNHPSPPLQQASTDHPLELEIEEQIIPIEQISASPLNTNSIPVDIPAISTNPILKKNDNVHRSS